MNPQYDEQYLKAARRKARRTALLLGLVAAGFFLLFMLMPRS